MIKIERILCPVDFSEYSNKAYDYAYSLARHYGAKLFVEHVVQPLTVAYPYYGFPESTAYDVYGNLASDAMQRLKELVQARSCNGLQPEAVVEKGLAAVRALDYAFSLAMEYDAELTLLHVLEEGRFSSDVAGSVSDAKECLENSVPKDAGDWCKIKTVVRIGKPYQEIVQIALELQSDLVVLGVCGRNALDLALFGSTSHRVIQLGSRPVLAVHI